MSKGIYKYTDLESGEIVYVGKDSHIDRNKRHKQHLQFSNYDVQPFNRILQNNPKRYEYSVIWATKDCTTLKLNKMEILFGKIYDPKFNFGKFGSGGYNGHTEQTKMKISESHIGKTHTEETRRKISKSKKGKKLSEEHKQKLSESHKGENNHMYGKHHSNETRKKMSETQNTTGYMNVCKVKNKTCKQGFIWRYQYYENGKRFYITAVDINKLEAKVKVKGLEWREL